MYSVVIELVEILDDASMSLLWSYGGLQNNDMVRSRYRIYFCNVYRFQVLINTAEPCYSENRVDAPTNYQYAVIDE